VYFSFVFVSWNSIDLVGYRVCAMCMWGLGVGLLWVVPSFASWSAISLDVIPTRALIFCIVMLRLVHGICVCEQFLKAVVLGRLMSYVIANEVYVLEIVHEYECVLWLVLCSCEGNEKGI
jgi:hypothetical protein